MRHALHRQVIWCLQWWIVNKDCVTTLKSYYCICLIRWIIWIWGIVCHRREKTWWVELRLLCSAEQCSTWQRQWPMNEDQNGFSLTNLIPKISIKRLIIDMGSLPGWIIPNDWGMFRQLSSSPITAWEWNWQQLGWKDLVSSNGARDRLNCQYSPDIIYIYIDSYSYGTWWWS